jgi:hypothetical protein
VIAIGIGGTSFSRLPPWRPATFARLAPAPQLWAPPRESPEGEEARDAACALQRSTSVTQGVGTVSVIDTRLPEDGGTDGRAASCAALTAKLRARFAGQGDDAVIDGLVADEYARFVDARVTTFVPLLVERRVAERLRSRA